MVVLDGRLPDLPGRGRSRSCTATSFSARSRHGPDAGGEIGPAAEALDHAADDYLSKPFAPELLIARVGAVLRRARRYAS